MTSSRSEVSVAKFQKMVFLYNAIMNGWTVQKISDTEISFTKDDNHRTISLGDFVHNQLEIK